MTSAFAADPPTDTKVSAITPPLIATLFKSPFAIPSLTSLHSLTSGDVFNPKSKLETAFFLSYAMVPTEAPGANPAGGLPGPFPISLADLATDYSATPILQNISNY